MSSEETKCKERRPALQYGDSSTEGSKLKNSRVEKKRLRLNEDQLYLGTKRRTKIKNKQKEEESLKEQSKTAEVSVLGWEREKVGEERSKGGKRSHIGI